MLGAGATAGLLRFSRPHRGGGGGCAGGGATAPRGEGGQLWRTAVTTKGVEWFEDLATCHPKWAAQSG